MSDIDKFVMETETVTVTVDKDWIVENNASFDLDLQTVASWDSTKEEVQEHPIRPIKKKRQRNHFKSKDKDVFVQSNYCTGSIDSDSRCELPAAIDGKFFFYDMSNFKGDKDERIKVKCVKCDNAISTSLNTTTNLHRHIKRVHPLHELEFRDYCITKRRTLSQNRKGKPMINDSRCEFPAAIDGKFFSYDISNYKGDKDERIKVKCVKCENAISTSLNTTTNLHRHIKRVHPLLEHEFRDYCTTKRRTLSQNRKGKLVPMNSQKNTLDEGISPQENLTKLERLERGVLRYIIKDLRPLSTVDSKNFRAMFTDIDPELESGRTASQCIDKEFSSVKEKLIKIFSELEYLCSTANIWSSKHRSFLGVTVHWIDSQSLERMNSVLACRQFRGGHTYDQITKLLLNIFQEFNILKEHHLGTITDNVCNFKKTFQELGIELSSCVPPEVWSTKDEEQSGFDGEYTIIEEEIWMDIDFQNLQEKLDEVNYDNDLDKLPPHFRGMDHSLNLLASVDFVKCLIANRNFTKLHETVMKKCNLIWSGANRLKINKQYKDITGSTVITPVITKWNSVFNALMYLFQNKQHLNSLLNVRMSETTLEFTNTDIEYIEELIAIMKPIANGLDILQSNSYYGYVLPVIFSIHGRLKIMAIDIKGLKYLSSTLLKLLDYFEDRFHEQLNLSPQFEDAVLAACFHPKFKNAWVNKTQEEFVMNLCKRAILQLNNDSNNCSPINNTDDEFYLYPLEKKKSGLEEDNKTKVELELELATYFKASYNDNLLKFFSIFPRIRTLFIKYNTLLPSSAPVEQLFSYGNLILTPTRNLFSDSKFEEIIFLKELKFSST